MGLGAYSDEMRYAYHRMGQESITRSRTGGFKDMLRQLENRTQCIFRRDSQCVSQGGTRLQYKVSDRRIQGYAQTTGVRDLVHIQMGCAMPTIV